MQKLKPFIAYFLLVLLLFPLVEKISHELGHLDNDSCDVQGLHFCAKEHHCNLCDYVFSSSALPPQSTNNTKAIVPETIQFISLQESHIMIPPPYFFSLRAPPAC